MDRDLQSEEVTWEVDSIPVYGTLVRPAGHGPFPGFVFVAGSGPTDRDWCSPLLPGTNCSGRLLAERLAREGFLTLRYDKRIAGSHGRENLPKLMGKITMQGHTDELAGAVRRLLADKTVDPDRLSVLTSSEGAIHALHYQLQKREGLPHFSRLVLTGPPGRSVSRVARSQILAQVADRPDRDDLMTRFDTAVAEALAGQLVRLDPSLPEGAHMLLQSIAAPVNKPFVQELWTTEPAGLLAQIQVPVLVVIGKKDIQIDWKKDGKILEEATEGHKNVTFAYPDNADHVLKYDPDPRGSRSAAETGERYNAKDRRLDPDAWNIIQNWLQR